MTNKMTGAEAIIKSLEIEEIKYVYGVPGESFLSVMNAIYESNSLTWISARHEGGASFMAEGYGKASKKPGVVMATRGVGGANLSIGVHTAYQDSTPMLVLLGQVNSKFRGREGFQEVELDQFFSHISKWTTEIRDVERIPEIIQKALRIAQTGRPGPVVVSLPEDILQEEAEMFFGEKTYVPRPLPSKSEIDSLMEGLSKSKRPLIIAGAGVTHGGAHEELKEFSEKYHIPVLASFRRHDCFPNDHELYVGHSGLGTFKGIIETIKEADTIISLGARFSEVTTQGYSAISNDQKIYHVDIESSSLGKVYATDLGLIGDIKETLSFILDQEYDLQPSWIDWANERRTVYKKLTKIEYKENEYVDNKQIIHSLQKNLPSDTIITNDAGNFSSWLQNYYQFKNPNTYIGPTSGAMGYGLPAALGAKLANPNKLVVTLAGDGGFMMTMSELETAVREKISVLCLVFNNGMYGTIRMHQEMHYPYNVIGTDLEMIPFRDLASALNIPTYLVERDQDFEGILKEALTIEGPVLIELINKKENISVQKTIDDLRENI